MFKTKFPNFVFQITRKRKNKVQRTNRRTLGTSISQAHLDKGNFLSIILHNFESRYSVRYDNIFDNLICQTTYSTLLKNLSPSCSYIPIATSTHLHLNGPFPAFFLSIFVFSLQLTVNVQYRFLPMTGFKPRTSIIGSDRPNN